MPKIIMKERRLDLPSLVFQQSELRTSGADYFGSQAIVEISYILTREKFLSLVVFANMPFKISAETNISSLLMQHKRAQIPVVLSIAGHDPSSGAGITADIKTIAAHGCYGVTCITALTVQSTRGVKRVDPIEGRIITETLAQLMDDLDIAGVKIGMLGSAEAAKSVAAFLKRYSIGHIVLDPIIRSSSGAELISRDGLDVMKYRILSRARVIAHN